jgi:SAM-dependent methyltransferase
MRFASCSKSIADVGAGDGQTFALAAGALSSANIAILEPSKAATERYERMLASHANLNHLKTCNAGLTDIKAAFPGESFDLVTCLRAIYYADPEPTLVDMYELLDEGGMLAIVFAEETTGISGKALLHYLDTTDQISLRQHYKERLQSRERLLSAKYKENAVELLDEHFPMYCASLKVQHAPSRFYGHQLRNLAEMCLAGDLCYAGQKPGDDLDLTKLIAAVDLICTKPETVDLCVEGTGKREGMLSVAQPQRMVVITKNRREIE